MQISLIQDYCIAKKGVEATYPFGPDTLVYKVIGKAFLLVGFNEFEISINVKCNPEKAITLREQHSFIKPGYHMNKKHWNTIDLLENVPVKLIKECIDDSYNLVVDKLTKKEKLILNSL